MSTITTTTETPTNCLPWCRTDDPDNHREIDDPREPDDGEWFHSRVLAAGTDARLPDGSYLGQTYTVGLQYDGVTKLYVEFAVNTLTADQAEVLGRALLEGAEALRASGDTVERENVVQGYFDDKGWVKPPNAVFDPTPAELEVARTAQ